MNLLQKPTLDFSNAPLRSTFPGPWGNDAIPSYMVYIFTFLLIAALLFAGLKMRKMDNKVAMVFGYIFISMAALPVVFFILPWIAELLRLYLSAFLGRDLGSAIINETTKLV